MNDDAQIETETKQMIAQRNYEIFSKSRKNFSKDADELLEKIKNGYNPTETDAFILACDNPKRLEEYLALKEVEERIKDGYISKKDFDYLINMLNIGDKTIEDLMYQKFREKGILVDEYEEKDEHKKR